MTQEIEQVLSILKHRYKLILLGEQAVGKTSIITQYTYGNHEERYQATIGVDFMSKNVRINKNLYLLQLWDTAGQERFRSLVPTYIRGSSAAVVVYDVTNPRSFEKVDIWILDIRAERGDDVIIFLVGNKIDLINQRKVSKKEGMKKARKLNVFFIETSAKVPPTIVNLFQQIVQVLPEKNYENNDKDIVDITEHKNGKVKAGSTKNINFDKCAC